MKTMQEFYAQMTSASEEAHTLDSRLPALSKMSKMKLMEASREGVWYLWQASQLAAAA